jgi:tRNA(fMet)-specific endonuclease VapC
MIAFDTDVVTEIFAGNADYIRRASLIPPEQQRMPVVVAEEILPGRLNAIRRAEANKINLDITRAYTLLADAIRDFEKLRLLHYDPPAHDLFTAWRQQKIRVATHDLRIAAICVASSAKLILRNRRDFELVPGLNVEFWAVPNRLATFARRQFDLVGRRLERRRRLYDSRLYLGVSVRGVPAHGNSNNSGIVE